MSPPNLVEMRPIVPELLQGKPRQKTFNTPRWNCCASQPPPASFSRLSADAPVFGVRIDDRAAQKFSSLLQIRIEVFSTIHGSMQKCRTSTGRPVAVDLFAGASGFLCEQAGFDVL